MRVLHTFANWKWTGPAEPAVRLAEGLMRQHEVAFLCGHCPYDDLENLVAKAAAAAGLELIGGLRLRKHLDPVTGLRDLLRLTRILRERAFDVVHTHLLNDHLVAGLAARRAGGAGVVVRTVYGAADLAPRIRSAFVFGRCCDGVLAASRSAADLVARRTGLPAERLFVVPGAVDTARFAPERLGSLRAAARAELGCEADEILCGVVARIQRHRRFDLLLDAFARAARQDPRLRLVLIGRGTHADEIVRAPVRSSGLEDRVIFTGYRPGAEYDAVLAALDCGLFLVPGSDGSCRAARELAAASLPLIVSPRPPLPEIVAPGESGVVVAEEPAAFAAALAAMAADPGRRASQAAAARERAVRLFSVEGQARDVAEIYGRLADLGPWRHR